MYVTKKHQLCMKFLTGIYKKNYADDLQVNIPLALEKCILEPSQLPGEHTTICCHNKYFIPH